MYPCRPRATSYNQTGTNDTAVLRDRPSQPPPSQNSLDRDSTSTRRTAATIPLADRDTPSPSAHRDDNSSRSLPALPVRCRADRRASKRSPRPHSDPTEVRYRTFGRKELLPRSSASLDRDRERQIPCSHATARSRRSSRNTSQRSSAADQDRKSTR